MTAGPLSGRGAVVTGGGRGIGAAVAHALAVAGAEVVVAARTASEVERVAESISAHGGRAWAVLVDVAVESSVRAMGEKARVHLGTIDILVNNAGAAASAPLRKITLEEWNRLLAVNATGTFLCTREFAPEMVERGWGRVVSIASVAGLEGAKYVAHYSASKHAAVGFTRSVALELAGTGVTANVICPAYVDSPMTGRSVAILESRTGIPHDQVLASMLATTGQTRLVTPEEVADAVLRLCGQDAADMNGETIVINPRGARPVTPTGRRDT